MAERIEKAAVASQEGFRTSETFRVIQQAGFSKAELNAIEACDIATDGASSANLIELLEKLRPEHAAEFMRTPNSALEDAAPLDLLADRESYPEIRAAIGVFYEDAPATVSS